MYGNCEVCFQDRAKRNFGRTGFSRQGGIHWNGRRHIIRKDTWPASQGALDGIGQNTCLQVGLEWIKKAQRLHQISHIKRNGGHLLVRTCCQGHLTNFVAGKDDGFQKECRRWFRRGRQRRKLGPSRTKRRGTSGGGLWRYCGSGRSSWRGRSGGGTRGGRSCRDGGASRNGGFRSGRR